MKKIDIRPIFSDFENNLKGDDKKRIIFSGKFGIGKTYFLKEYFEEKKEDYEIFHLYPVNYQISSNEDIIDLFKYDILTELLKKGLKLDSKSDKIGASLIEILNNDLAQFAFSAISVAAGGIPIQGILKKIGKGFKDGKELLSLAKDSKVSTEQKFLDKIKVENINETDPLSQFIKEKIKEKKGKKKSVLILDDLDRIDPEHIFRILNIFSAHFDQHNGENKFGFDKIILVCDIKNISSIFYHKYGEKTDFRGYIDKFYDGEVYHYSVENFLDGICLLFEYYIRVSDANSTEMSILHFICYNAIKSKYITLRNIFHNIRCFSNCNIKSAGISVKGVLIKIFLNKENLVEFIDKLAAHELTTVIRIDAKEAFNEYLMLKNLSASTTLEGALKNYKHFINKNHE